MILSKLEVTSAFQPPKNAFTIVEKICLILDSCKLVYVMVLKCRLILAVILDRPPPGGPIAETSIISSILLKCFSLLSRSYQPPWSSHCRRNSIGGCAPYSSLFWHIQIVDEYDESFAWSWSEDSSCPLFKLFI